MMRWITSGFNYHTKGQCSGWEDGCLGLNPTVTCYLCYWEQVGSLLIGKNNGTYFLEL